MGQFVKVGTTAEMAQMQRGKFVEAAGQSIAVFQVGGGYYAIANECTHVGGPLSEGFVEGEQVSCPWHGARFNVKTGEVLCPPASGPVKSYPVRVNGADVEVEV